MNILRAAIRQRASHGARDGGFTLVELLVAMMLFLSITGMVLSAVIALSRGLDSTRVTTDVNSEARVALERMARELRQAKELTVADPGKMTIRVDFDGDGVINGSLADPEEVTYEYDSTGKTLSMTAVVPAATPTTFPLLAGQVSALTFTYTSSDWSKDADGDGTVTLAEAGVPGIDRVEIALTVSRDGSTQTYRTQVTLRNRSLT